MKAALLTTLTAIATLLTAASITGCSGYRLGAAAEPPLRTLIINPVINRTSGADLSVPVSTALREAILARGGIAIAAPGSTTGGILSVTLDGYQRMTAATDPADTALGDSFRLLLTGRATLLRADGTVLFRDRPFRAEAAAISRLDLIQAENQAAPVLAREFAEKVVLAIYSTW